MPPDTPPKARHGGARPGAGRKPRVVKYEHPIESAEQRCALRLSHTLQTIERLADGGEGDVVEEWAAAGTVTIGKGRDERPAFPDLPPDQLVLVSRKTNHPKPDVRANIYLSDRAMGRPGGADTLKIEEIVSAELQAFIEKIRSRFEPDVAQAIFRALSAPDGAPRAPLVLAPGPGDHSPTVPPATVPAAHDEPFRLS